MREKTLDTFVKELSSASPVPGGGGASALAGALSAALASMVANLTTGKKKYAQYQDRIDAMLPQAAGYAEKMLVLIEKDAEVFEPLSQAYSIPKDEPGRDETLENCLKAAAGAPFEMVSLCADIAKMISELADIGSRLAISDVGVAAALCGAACEGAAMNVYINTKLMKDREYALKLNDETEASVTEVKSLCEEAYAKVKAQLIGKG